MQPNDVTLLGEFETKDAPMLVVYADYLQGDRYKDLPNGSDLHGYHPTPSTKGVYDVNCEIKKEMGNNYLKVIPAIGTNSRWTGIQKDFLENLLYCPMPNQILTGRKPCLYLSKKIIDDDNKNQLSDTGWRVAHSRITKFDLEQTDGSTKEVNDVIFCWKHSAWEDYVVTCWKW